MDDTVEQDGEVGRLHAGDPLSWETLYRRVYPSMLAFARRRLATTEEAQDAVSEALTRTVAGIDRLGVTGASPESWLFGVLRHVVLDRQPRRTAAATFPLDARSMPSIPSSRWWSTRSAMPCGPHSSVCPSVTASSSSSGSWPASAPRRSTEVLDMRPGAVRTAQSRALERLRGLLLDVEQVGS